VLYLSFHPPLRAQGRPSGTCLMSILTVGLFCIGIPIPQRRSFLFLSGPQRPYLPFRARLFPTLNFFKSRYKLFCLGDGFFPSPWCFPQCTANPLSSAPDFFFPFVVIRLQDRTTISSLYETHSLCFLEFSVPKFFKSAQIPLFLSFFFRLVIRFACIDHPPDKC